MSKKIKKLENIKLLKELEFVESDFEYKREIIREVDIDFINTTNEFISKHKDLKEIIDEKMDSKMNNIIKEKENQEREEIIKDNILDVSDDRGDKIKKIYRDIVKLTHPDKVTDNHLNELYIKSNKYYEDNNLFAIYRVCNELSLKYEPDESDNELIKERIEILRKRIEFIESTFTWKWYTTEDIKERDRIIVDYIRCQLS